MTDLARAAARGTLVTLVLRVVSFVCTQYTFRSLDPDALGKAGIQLELLMTTVLFVSREGFRVSLTKDGSQEDGSKWWNTAWMTVPVVSVMSTVALAWHLWNNASKLDADFRLAGMLYCLASWLEGVAEPVVLDCLRNLDVPTRASAEGVATVAKTVTVFLALRFAPDFFAPWPVTLFGVAQLVYGTLFCAIMYYRRWSTLSWPSFSTSSFIDRHMGYLTAVFTVQGLFKHALTEGDRIVLAFVSDSYDQGVYAMGSAYGGMAARILLQPLEENARLLWSRQSSNETHLDALRESYTVLVKFVLYIGLVFSCLAVNYTHVLLNVLAGPKWGRNEQAATVLSAFCVYTAFLAANGMTEAFVYAVAASGKEVGRLGLAHTATGVVFALTALWSVQRYGTVGLVGANCVAMMCRTLYSISFAARYFEETRTKNEEQTEAQGAEKAEKSTPVTVRYLLPQMLPHPVVLVGFAGAWLATRWSLGSLFIFNGDVDRMVFHPEYNIRKKEWLVLTGRHVAVGLSCAVGILSLVYTFETSFRKSLISMLRVKRKQS